VKDIPRGPAGQGVQVRFTYDLNGVLEVEATVVETRQRFTHVITRYARGLSREQLEKAVRDLEKFKTHPREDAVNRFLLRRAERAYQELPAEQREMLSRLLDGFEEALDLQDAAAVERHRAALQQFLERHDPGRQDHGQGDEDDDWYRA
jgi:molecular chaperone HscC